MPYFFDHESLDDVLINQVIATVRRSLNETILPRLQASGNIPLSQSDALLWCGMRLRHIDESGSWIHTGVGLYNDAFVRQVEADGLSCEHDPHYHGVP